MNDDDFLDRLLNSSGDDLDRLIQNDKAKSKHKYKHLHHDFEVDMSDIEKILNSKSPLESVPLESTIKQIPISKNIDDVPDYSEECFKRVYDQLTTETYCIDRISALQKTTQNRRRIKVTTIVIKTILVAIGICLCLGGAIWFSQLLLRWFPV